MGLQMVWHFIFCFYFFLIIRERMVTMTTTPHTHYHHDNSNSGDNHKTWWGVQPRKRTERERLLENGAMEARVNGKGRELLSTGGWGCDCDLGWILASLMHWAAYRASKWYYFLIEENFFFLAEFHALRSFYHHKLLAFRPLTSGSSHSWVIGCLFGVVKWICEQHALNGRWVSVSWIGSEPDLVDDRMWMGQLDESAELCGAWLNGSISIIYVVSNLQCRDNLIQYPISFD